ncbi:MAG: hypothetical protein IID06_01130 [Gemmatimonadetes bacterium]|nr:hypothetical protein [Gemmatimonadota bacterium]
MELLFLFVLLLYGVPIGAAIWLLMTVARIARTLDSVSHRLVTIEQVLTDRDIG